MVMMIVSCDGGEATRGVGVTARRQRAHVRRLASYSVVVFVVIVVLRRLVSSSSSLSSSCVV